MLFFRVTPTGGNGDGDNYLDITGTLAAGETEITLTDSHIETDGIYDFYTSKYGVVPTDVEIAAGSVTLTFDAQSENITVMVRKWGESGGGSSSWDYSTNETDTKQKWIDGKEIYCKVINGTFNFTANTPVSIVEKGDLETLVDCRIIAYSGVASPQVYFDSNVVKGIHYARFDATSVILYYTKTTTGG